MSFYTKNSDPAKAVRQRSQQIVAYRTTPKMAERKKAHREKLLHAAIGLFGRHGYHATTVPMIVKESGSSTGAFYFYFRDKEDVFASALEAIGGQVNATLNEAMNGTEPETISQMKAAVEAFILYLARHPNEARI